MDSSNPNPYKKHSDSHGGPTTGVPAMSSHQPPVHPPHHHLSAEVQVPWSTGLYDCFSDIRNCCITCWCPCITFGQISEIVDKGSSSCGVNGALYAVMQYVTGFACLYSCYYRSKLRQEYALKEDPCGDLWVHCFCEYCALCQEYRELQNRGFNMFIGWRGNVDAKNREVAMAPVVEGGMSR